MSVAKGVFHFATLSLLPFLLGAGLVFGEEKPNIVVILCDDLGYGDVHSFGGEQGKIRTPHFDRLAREGMRFTDAHSGSSVCTPTRYGLLTGRYAWRTKLQRGVLDNYVEPLIAPERLTLGGMLQKSGYETACIGKWHLGFTVDQPTPKGSKQFAGAPMGARTSNGPTTRGFDRFIGFHHARMMESLFSNDRVTEFLEPVAMLPRLARESSEYVLERASSKKPFFLYLPLSSPHSPVVPSQHWKGKSGMGSYADFVMQTDDAIGQVLAAIDTAQLAEETIVIVTSDNGCTPGVTDELIRQGHYPSGRLRGYKSDIWEGGHRVPFVVRWPGKVPASSSCESTICLTDIMATCAEITHSDIPENAAEDSFSFLSDLKNTGTTDRRQTVHHSIHGSFAIRESNFKLCLSAGSGGWSKTEDESSKMQLYDLANDIGEQVNLISNHEAETNRLKRQLEKIVADGRSTPGPQQANDAIVDIFNTKRETKQESKSSKER